MQLAVLALPAEYPMAAKAAGPDVGVAGKVPGRGEAMLRAVDETQG